MSAARKVIAAWDACGRWPDTTYGILMLGQAIDELRASLVPPDNEAAFDKLTAPAKCDHNFVPHHPLGMPLDYVCEHCNAKRSHLAKCDHDFEPSLAHADGTTVWCCRRCGISRTQRPPGGRGMLE